MNNKIFWITSYPKSGNTWLRLIICGLFFTKNGNLNNLKILNKIPKFDEFENFKFIKKISASDFDKIFKKKLYDEEAQSKLSKYWVEAQKKIIIKKNKYNFFKTHNARIRFNDYFYTNEITTLGFIYITRDPRDVVISYSKYLDKSLDYATNFITNNNLMGNQNTLSRMPEFIYNWKDHYLSWKNFKKVPGLFLRYEDLLNNTEYEINKIIDFFYLNYNIRINNKLEKINNIIQSTNFKKLQEIENNIGFYEAPNYGLKNERSFFRAGKINQWKNKLSKDQKSLIKEKFKKQMTELKYLF